jgi:hypothetical protein
VASYPQNSLVHEPVQVSRRREPDHIAEYFLLFEIICQVALLIPAFGAVRQVMRIAAFGASSLLLAIVSGKGRQHPASQPLILVLFIMSFSLMRATTTTWSVGIAAILLNLAIVAPVFWVPALRVDLTNMRRVLLILWAFHSVSAAVGILQVYFPGRFQPQIASMFAGSGNGYLQSLMIVTNTGQQVFRPMGLTDNPGGAGLAGYHVVLLGLTILVSERRRWFRMVAITTMTLGLAAIALSQQRSTLLILLTGIVAFFVLLGVRNFILSGRRTKSGQIIRRIGVAKLVTMLGLVFVFALGLALSLASKSVTERFATLAGGTASDVYYSNRGYFLEETINDDLPLYPLGAGLGRWGMVNYYFGDNNNSEVPPLWAEIQWSGWLYDGGVPLILAYVAALWMAFRVALKITLGRNPSELGVYAAFLFAYNVGAFADTFDCPFFIGQGGLEFWFLNALLFAVAQQPRSCDRIPSSR